MRYVVLVGLAAVFCAGCSGGGGGGGGGDFDTNRFIYATEQSPSDARIGVHAIFNDQLRFVSSGVFSDCVTPRGVAAHRGGGWVYVACDEPADGIAVFAADRATGELTFQTLAPTSFAGPTSLKMVGDLLFVAHEGDATSMQPGVSVFSVAPGTGQLTEVATSSTADVVEDIVYSGDPQGGCVFGAIYGGALGSVQPWTLDVGGSSLTPGTPVGSAGELPVALLLMEPFLYSADMIGDDVSIYGYNENTCVVTAAGSQPVGSGPSDLVGFEGTPRNVYVANSDAETVETYAQDVGTGALTLVNTTPTFSPWSVDLSNVDYRVIVSPLYGSELYLLDLDGSETASTSDGVLSSGYMSWANLTPP